MRVLDVDVPRKALEIGAGAERPARPRQDDDRDVVAGRELGGGGLELAIRLCVERVQLRGPVERDPRAPLRHLDDETGRLAAGRAHSAATAASAGCGATRVGSLKTFAAVSWRSACRASGLRSMSAIWERLSEWVING